MESESVKFSENQIGELILANRDKLYNAIWFKVKDDALAEDLTPAA